MPNLSAPRFFVRVRRPGATTYLAELEQDLASDQPRQSILSMHFEDDEKQTDKLTLHVDNHDLSALDGDVWLPDNVMEFSFGFPGMMSPTREAVIVKLSGFDPLVVEADSKDVLMGRVQRTDRVFDGPIRRSDVVRTILRENGYEGTDLHVEDTPALVDQVSSSGMTDLQLVKSLATREGFEFYVDFDGAHFRRRDTRQRPIRTFVYYGEGANVISLHLSHEKRAGKPGAVVLEGKDATTGDPFTVRGDADSTKTDRTALSSTTDVHGTEAKEIETVDETTGETFVTSSPAAAASASEARAATSETNAAAAQQVANGAFLKQQLQGVHVELAVPLDPLLTAKSLVTLSGAGRRLAGNWYVKKAAHDMDNLTTTMTLAREGMNDAGVETKSPTNEKEGPAADANGTAGDPTARTEELELVDGQTGETTTVATERGGRGQ